MLSNSSQRVMFNLDGVDVWAGVSRAAAGRGGATDWELLQLKYGDYPKVEFWQNGVQVGSPVQMSTIDLSKRRFQLWEYRVSHGALLIRSPKGPGIETNKDIIFSGVSYVQCPRMLRDLELVSETPNDVRRIRETFGAVIRTNQVFVLLSSGIRHLIVAVSCHVSENMDDIFDTPLI